MKKIIKKSAVLAMILALAVTSVSQMTVLAASNDSNQVASTSKATSIKVRGKTAATEVTTITFPEGAPSAVISAPYNDVEGSGDPQVLSDTASEPVVRLYNDSGGILTTWLEITTWTDGVAASEDYELVATGTATVAAVDDVLSADGNAASVNTAVTIDAATYKDLYLKLTLSASAGKSGTSTLTVLGES